MRTLVVSDRSRTLLEGSIVGRAVGFGRQLADRSWEVSVDDDMGFALDCLSGDPDRAIEMVCAPDIKIDFSRCPRCRAELDFDWCWTCKMLVW